MRDGDKKSPVSILPERIFFLTIAKTHSALLGPKPLICPCLQISSCLSYMILTTLRGILVCYFIELESKGGSTIFTWLSVRFSENNTGINSSDLSKENFFFLLSQDQSKRFSNLLLHYSLNGFDEDEIDGAPTDEEIFNRDFYLESSWKEVVDGSEEMERHDRVQQEAIWELITTEKTYIADLRVVTEVRIRVHVNPGRSSLPGSQLKIYSNDVKIIF